ncbi:MAG: hypothetical protein KatS3mg002_0188 [Candidatus Woesearchaeota archaeon]|nr:MAG: hypothetical protein KatS3mg002_0188 [Candidatus Woesearchaeota archaeon]
MKDRTPIYMIIIVAIVALVGIVTILTTQGNQNTIDENNQITGNVIFEDNYYSTAQYKTVGKIVFTLFLLGISGYLYFKFEQ